MWLFCVSALAGKASRADRTFPALERDANSSFTCCVEDPCCCSPGFWEEKRLLGEDSGTFLQECL